MCCFKFLLGFIFCFDCMSFAPPLILGLITSGSLVQAPIVQCSRCRFPMSTGLSSSLRKTKSYLSSNNTFCASCGKPAILSANRRRPQDIIRKHEVQIYTGKKSSQLKISKDWCSLGNDALDGNTSDEKWQSMLPLDLNKYFLR